MEHKHPVSLLQEFMAQQHKELPIYEIVDILGDVGHQFECTVQIEDFKFVAIATSKQFAKKIAATKALEFYGLLNTDKIELEVKNADSPITVNYNAVGQLNELTAKRKLPYPTYIEYGIKVNNFEVKCSLLHYTTVGFSTKKKLAKQVAASHMLKQLEEEKIINASVNSPLCELDINDNDVIEKYKQLSLLSPKISESKEIDIKNEVKDEKNIKNTLNFAKESPPKTLTEMYDELASVNISYAIDIICRKPFVLVLKFEDEHNTTVVESGENYEEVQMILIQNALKVIQAY